MNLQDLIWRKSSRSSGGGSGDCVEVAAAGSSTAVRDSKAPHGAVLVYGSAQWAGFLSALKAGSMGRR